MIKESSSGSIRTLILSNEKLSVKILAGKGGDINQITYLPEQAELLHTERCVKETGKEPIPGKC